MATISRDAGLAPAGTFPNGTTAEAVVQFILDYEQSARIEDVARHFGIEVEDVATALAHHARTVGGRQAPEEGSR